MALGALMHKPSSLVNMRPQNLRVVAENWASVAARGFSHDTKEGPEQISQSELGIWALPMFGASSILSTSHWLHGTSECKEPPMHAAPCMVAPFKSASCQSAFRFPLGFLDRRRMEHFFICSRVVGGFEDREGWQEGFWAKGQLVPVTVLVFSSYLWRF